MIRPNAYKYSILALCRCLGIARSTYNYECTGKSVECGLGEATKIAYDENRHVYGQRKIKHVLLRRGLIVSRRRIGRIMKRRGLVSAYMRKKYRVHASKVNEAPVANLLDRKFSDRLSGAYIVSDLTYVRVGSHWAYIYYYNYERIQLKTGLTPYAIRTTG